MQDLHRWRRPILAAVKVSLALCGCMVRPWSDRPIHDCGEPLLALEPALLCLRPHPYQSVGAPYGKDANPFCLRRSVCDRLIRAQGILREQEPSLRLAIFDAWRPITVQAFMVEHAIAEECSQRGLDPLGVDQPQVRQDVRTLVGRFWAPPSDDPLTPPPHSTGAAVDVTLADHQGQPLEMGGAIDAISAVSEPEHYACEASLDPLGEPALWHRRRRLLASCLVSQGFVRHPNEWWHFSFGDQLWAWSTDSTAACYGRIDQTDPISSATA